MAKFKLHFLSFISEANISPNAQTNTTKFLKTTISEFYPQTEKRADTFCWSYNEKISLHKNSQKELTFSMDKMILKGDEWVQNPFTSVLKIGAYVLLEDKFNHQHLFNIKQIQYDVNEFNTVYSFSCQDSFTYALSNQRDGYSIGNDPSSEDFIGAKTLDWWAYKIWKDCSIPYQYIPLARIDTENGKTYSFTKDTNPELFKTTIFSGEGTADSLLISLAEKYGMMVMSNEVLTENGLKRSFWFDLAKHNESTNLVYSPYSDIQSFGLSASGDNLVSVLNINGGTIGDDLVTALPEAPSFFTQYFLSKDWENSDYYPGMYGDIVSKAPLEVIEDSETQDKKNHQIWESFDDMQEGDFCISDKWIYNYIGKRHIPKLYDRPSFMNNEYDTKFEIADDDGNVWFFSNLDRDCYLTFGKDDKKTLEGKQISSEYLDTDIELYLCWRKPSDPALTSTPKIQNYRAYLQFVRAVEDDEQKYADLADKMPWLENKIVDFSYFFDAGIINKATYSQLNNYFNNALRRINGKLITFIKQYYQATKNKVETISQITNDLDLLGAQANNSIIQSYKKNSSIGDLTEFTKTYNQVFKNMLGDNTAERNNILNYDVTLSDYVNKFIDTEQKFLKNIYNFTNYFNSQINFGDKDFGIYKYTISVAEEDDDDSSTSDSYYYIFEDKEMTLADSSTDIYNKDTGKPLYDLYRKENGTSDKDGAVVDTYSKIAIEDIPHIENGSFINGFKIPNTKDDAYINIEDGHEWQAKNEYFEKDETAGVVSYTKMTPFDLLKKYFINPIASAIIKDENNNPRYYIKDRNTFRSFSTDLNKLISDPKCGLQVIWKFYQFPDTYLRKNNWDSSTISDPNLYINAYAETIDVTLYYKNNGTYNLKSSVTLVNRNNYQQYYKRIKSTDDFDKYGEAYKNIDNQKATVENRVDYFDKWLAPKSSNSVLDYSFIHLDSVVLRDGNDRYVHMYIPSADTYNRIKTLNNNCTQYTDKHGQIVNITTDELLKYLAPTYYMFNFAGSSGDAQDSNNLYVWFNREKDNFYYRPTYLRVLTSNDPVSSSNLNNISLLKLSNTRKEGRINISNQDFENFMTSDFVETINHLPSNYGKIRFNKTMLYAFDEALISSSKLDISFKNVHNVNDMLNKLGGQHAGEAAGGIDYFKIPSLSDDDNDYFAFVVEENFNYVPLDENNTFTVEETISEVNNKTYTRKVDTKYSPSRPYPLPLSTTTTTTITVANKEDAPTPGTKTTSYKCGYNPAETYYKFSNHQTTLIYDDTENDAVSKAIVAQADICYIPNELSIANTIDCTVSNIKQVYGDNVDMFKTPIFYKVVDKEGDKTLKRFKTAEQLVENEPIYYSSSSSFIEYDVYENKSIFSVPLVRVEKDKSSSNTLTIKQTNLGYHTLTFDENKRASFIDDNGVTITFKVECGNNELGSSASKLGTAPTNGSFWYWATQLVNDEKISDLLFEYAATIELELTGYWTTAYNSSLYSSYFLPEDWKPISQGTTSTKNYFSPDILSWVEENGVGRAELKSKFLPTVTQIAAKNGGKLKKYIWKYNPEILSIDNDTIASEIGFAEDNYVSFGEAYGTNGAMVDIRNILTDWGVYDNKWLMTEYGYTYYYNSICGGVKWSDILGELKVDGASYYNQFDGWYPMFIKVFSKQFKDLICTNYEKYKREQTEMWKRIYTSFPGLILEKDYSNEDAGTSEELYLSAEAYFKDMHRPSYTYNVSTIDVNKLFSYNSDYSNGDVHRFGPVDYEHQEIKIGDSILLNAAEITTEFDEVYDAFTKYLFVTDKSYSLRNDSDVSLTVDVLKYQDKLIQKLAKLIK